MSFFLVEFLCFLISMSFSFKNSYWLISWRRTESSNIVQWMEEKETTSGWCQLCKKTKRKICWIQSIHMYHSWERFPKNREVNTFQSNGLPLWFPSVLPTTPHTSNTNSSSIFCYYVSRIFLLLITVLCSRPQQDCGLALYKRNSLLVLITVHRWVK